MPSLFRLFVMDKRSARRFRRGVNWKVSNDNASTKCPSGVTYHYVSEAGRGHLYPFCELK